MPIVLIVDGDNDRARAHPFAAQGLMFQAPALPEPRSWACTTMDVVLLVMLATFAMSEVGSMVLLWLSVLGAVEACLIMIWSMLPQALQIRECWMTGKGWEEG